MIESICHLAQVLIASVTATFVCHIFLGEDPAFVIPSIGHLSGILYVLVIPTAGLAALAGAAFQKGTLIWRDRIKRIKRIPFFLKPAVGAAMNWLIGISVFFAIGKIGVFGLGYGDLEKMFYGSISGPQAILLAIAKFSCDDCRLCLGRCWRDLFACPLLWRCNRSRLH
jgi:H+/Cl- antiporter ClcA